MTALSRSLFAAFCLFMVSSLSNCSADGHVRGWQPLDLLPYGVSVSVLAPPDAEVKVGSLKSALVSDLTIKGGSDYSIQLFYGPAITNDIAHLKNEHMENVRDNRYFNKIVKEEVAGFIYQSVIDSTATYGFRFVKLQGDQELNFQTGLGALFSLEDVQLMYEAVKQLVGLFDGWFLGPTLLESGRYVAGLAIRSAILRQWLVLRYSPVAQYVWPVSAGPPFHSARPGTGKLVLIKYGINVASQNE